MKRLIDAREPITLAEIDKAIKDGRAYLAGDDLGGDLLGGDLVARLLAIVEDAYAEMVE